MTGVVIDLFGYEVAVRPRRGHRPKIALAVRALESSGALLPELRPMIRNALVWRWLADQGYGRDMPSRQALDRFFADHCIEQSGQERRRAG
jgi:hypothetical protein